MANLGYSLLLLLFSIFCMSTLVEPALVRPVQPRSRSPSYIEASCRATRYPTLCIQYLSTFSNSTIHDPQLLAQAASYASLYRARSTRTFMLKLAKELKTTKAKEYRLVKDCLGQMDGGVEQLSQSIRELRRLGGKEATTGGGDDGVFWQISNVETRTSAALTNAYSYVDEFPGRRMSKLKPTIKGKVLNVAQATSNALALFHQYASRFRARASTTAP